MTSNIMFLLNLEPDPNGRTVHEYLHFEDHEWEEQHDVIQMAFPTKTRSKFHPDQPYIPADFDFATLSDDHRQRIRATISLLLHSYMRSLGVEFLINRDRITFTTNVDAPYWAESRDHNTLRLTRILECLGIFGLTEIQTALHDFLVYNIAVRQNGRINAKTVAYWVAARENKLNLLS